MNIEKIEQLLKEVCAELHAEEQTPPFNGGLDHGGNRKNGDVWEYCGEPCAVYSLGDRVKLIDDNTWVCPDEIKGTGSIEWFLKNFKLISRPSLRQAIIDKVWANTQKAGKHEWKQWDEFKLHGVRWIITTTRGERITVARKEEDCEGGVISKSFDSIPEDAIFIRNLLGEDKLDFVKGAAYRLGNLKVEIITNAGHRYLDFVSDIIDVIEDFSQYRLATLPEITDAVNHCPDDKLPEILKALEEVK